MKVLAYTPLHYGKEYLRESILSYKDIADKIIFLYSEKPSYGHDTNLKCPDSEQELRDIVFSTTDKAEWIKVTAGNEGQHRSIIWNYTQGYDLLIATDADEVWKIDELKHALGEALQRGFRRYNIDGFINFYRNFNQVCYDGFRPARIFNLHGQGEAEIKATIYHFGYAIDEILMRYKWSCHGHQTELRPDWIDGTYLTDTLTDLHPVAISLWNAQNFDKNTLPEFMKSHPKFKL